ncbi:MAG TPA: hypothetical protein PLP42_17370 [Acidobacteriota bacterium]|nr:hypothetical protein [Acidobacteriota bacterium]
MKQKDLEKVTADVRDAHGIDIDETSFDAAELRALEQYYLSEADRIASQLRNLEERLNRRVSDLEILENRLTERLNALDALEVKLKEEVKILAADKTVARPDGPDE